MAKKAAKTMNLGLVDYWFGTITGAIVVGMSVQMTLSILTSYIPGWLSLDSEEMYGSQSMPTDFLVSQLIIGLIGILVGLAFLAIRKPKK